MRHPEHVAGLLREGSTWREPFQVRGGRAFDADSWEDACHALAGAAPIATAAFLWVHNRDQGSRRILERHLLGLVPKLSNGVTPLMLVSLALDEQHCPQAQRRDDLRALVLNINPLDWRRSYQRIHARLLSELDQLHGDAWRVARRRMDGE